MNYTSFFAQSSGFTINDSHIFEVGRDVIINNIATGGPAERVVTPSPGRGKENETEGRDPEAGGQEKKHKVSNEASDGLMIVHPRDIDLHVELASGSNYCTHSASYGGRVVAIKVFGGPHAKQTWTANVALAKKLLHPNLLKIVGLSGERPSECPFIVFRGVFEKRMNSLLANALCTDLDKSVQLSMKTVKGLASGLGCMESFLSMGTVSDSNWENCDVFVGYGDEPVISINVLESAHVTGSAPPSSNIENHGSWVEVLNRLCQKLFSEANSILYDDSPERDLDTYTSDVHSRVVQINSESSSNVPENNSSSAERPTVSKTPRREVWWKPDESPRCQSLGSIARRFKDRLDCVSQSSRDSSLRHITSLHPKWTSHNCPGYLREEITLTADVSRSAVIAYQYPSQSEICLICGQLVQYPTKQLDLPRLDIPTADAASPYFDRPKPPSPAGAVDRFSQYDRSRVSVKRRRKMGLAMLFTWSGIDWAEVKSQSLDRPEPPSSTGAVDGFSQYDSPSEKWRQKPDLAQLFTRSGVDSAEAKVPYSDRPEPPFPTGAVYRFPQHGQSSASLERGQRLARLKIALWGFSQRTDRHRPRAEPSYSNRPEPPSPAGALFI